MQSWPCPVRSEVGCSPNSDPYEQSTTLNELNPLSLAFSFLLYGMWGKGASLPESPLT